jgi:hypothetical protein
VEAKHLKAQTTHICTLDLPIFLKGNKFRACGYVQLLCLKFCFVYLILPYIASCNDEQMTSKLNEVAIFATIPGCC